MGIRAQRPLGNQLSSLRLEPYITTTWSNWAIPEIIINRATLEEVVEVKEVGK
jgi:hypothetical protein